MEQNAPEIAAEIWGALVRRLPWATRLEANLSRDGARIDHVERRDNHPVWFVHVGITQALQDRYGLAPELLLLVAQKIHGNDLAAAREQLEGSDRLDPDVVLVCDREPGLAGRLQRLALKDSHRFLPLSSDGGLEEELVGLLPTRDLFDRRDPVRGRFQVWGREREHTSLKRAVVDGQAMAVVGLRKIGKSTLVHGVLEELRQAEWIVGHVDLQGHLADLSTQAVSRELGSADGSLDGLRRCLLERAEAGGRSVLFLDEFDFLFDERCQVDVVGLFGLLRGLAQERGCVSVVLAGRDPSLLSAPRIRGAPNPFLVWTRPLWLGGLEARVAEALLQTIGARVGLKVDQELVEFAWQWSAGHPLVHRLVGSRALEAARARGGRPPVPTGPLFEDIRERVQRDRDTRRIAAEVNDLLRDTDAARILRQASSGSRDLEGDEDALELLENLDLLVPRRVPSVPGYLRAWYARRPVRSVRLSA